MSYKYGYCSSLMSVTIPSSVTSIEDYTFAGCNYMTSVSIGDNVTSIGNFAFAGCRCLISVTIPNSVTSIGDDSFFQCYGLSSVTIGNGVTSIGNEAFAFCSDLTNVYCYAEHVPETDYGIFLYSNCENTTLHVPAGAIDAYSNAEQWKEFKDIIALSIQSCPDDNHPHAIDLGLPSGTKWACCNVGADKPEDYGGYYAWGETEEKSYYDFNNYIYWDDYYIFLGYDIAGTQYDVAHVKWGDSWVMPSLTQIQELMENSTYDFTSINEVNGACFTGPNGGTIFMPAAGLRRYDDLDYVGRGGNYWTSTLFPNTLSHAYRLHFTENTVFWYYDYYRESCLNVRPVTVSTTNVIPSKSFSDVSSSAVYNLYGIKVAENADNIKNLPSGIYIFNGKRIVVK